MSTYLQSASTTTITTTTMTDASMQVLTVTLNMGKKTSYTFSFLALHAYTCICISLKYWHVHLYVSQCGHCYIVFKFSILMYWGIYDGTVLLGDCLVCIIKKQFALPLIPWEVACLHVHIPNAYKCLTFPGACFLNILIEAHSKSTPETLCFHVRSMPCISLPEFQLI